MSFSGKNMKKVMRKGGGGEKEKGRTRKNNVEMGIESAACVYAQRAILKAKKGVQDVPIGTLRKEKIFDFHSKRA
jgi:hypothetical protein